MGGGGGGGVGRGAARAAVMGHRPLGRGGDPASGGARRPPGRSAASSSHSPPASSVGWPPSSSCADPTGSRHRSGRGCRSHSGRWRSSAPRYRCTPHPGCTTRTSPVGKTATWAPPLRRRSAQRRRFRRRRIRHRDDVRRLRRLSQRRGLPAGGAGPLPPRLRLQHRHSGAGDQPPFLPGPGGAEATRRQRRATALSWRLGRGRSACLPSLRPPLLAERQPLPEPR